MKKLIAMLLALVLAFGLVACGGNEASGNDGDFEVPAEKWDGTLPLVAEGEDNVITIAINTSTNVLDYDTNAYTLWLEEQTGVDIEFVQFAGKSGDVGTQLSLMMAGGEELPDILMCGSAIDKISGEEYGADGYFIDLKPYFENYSYYFKEAFLEIFEGDTEVYDTIMKLAHDPSGEHIYAFPNIEEVPLDTPNSHAWINQQWLDKLGLTAPTTVEELYDVLVAFRDGDPNGNGKKDEIPLTGKITSYYNIEGFIVNAFVYYNYKNHFNVTDGKVWVPYNTDEYRQALIYLNKLVSEGLMSTLTWTQSTAELKTLINAENAQYTVGVIAGHADAHFEQGHDSIFTYVPLKPLKGATDKGGYGPMDYHTNKYRTYITADCDNPVLAFKLLDFMSCGESYMRQRWGEYGVDWEWAEPGQPGNMGAEAKFVKLNPNFWAEQNNGSWHLVNSVASEEHWQYAVDYSDLTNWDTVRATKLVEGYENYLAAGMPEEVYNFGIFTPEEFDRLADFQGDLTEYIKTNRAEFATGIKDPNDDAQWQTYLDGLNSLHLDEWIEIAQNSYDRMK